MPRGDFGEEDERATGRDIAVVAVAVAVAAVFLVSRIIARKQADG